MTSEIENLIRDLLLLYAKYGSATFEEAANELSRGAVSPEIAGATRELSRVATELHHGSSTSKKTRPSESAAIKAPEKRGRKRATDKYILELQSSEWEGGASVAKFVEEIARHRILDTRPLLRNYLDFLRLPIPDALSDRYMIAKRIGEHLQSLPAGEVEEKIKAGRKMKSPKSSLEAWANIIVKPESHP